MKWHKLLLLVFILSLGCRAPHPSSKLMLHDNWEFKQAGTKEWKPAEVPGVVHTDLLRHGLIPHPWKGTNEQKVQWIEQEDWVYQTTFNLKSSQLKRDGLDLVFEGLDTYAEVKLNDKLILEANNMFRTWRVNVKELLNKGQNNLEIRFKSPIKENVPKLEALGYELPAGSETVENKVSPFTRKAPYHFGWDWGPRLITSGIWRSIYLEGYDAARIEDVQIIQKSLSDSIAHLEAVVTIEATGLNEATIEVFDERVDYKLTSGTNSLLIPIKIKQPKRWWPNGWGEPHMYSIPLSISVSGNVLDSDTIKVGLRTVELVQDVDSIGKSFYFKINGEPFFAKGANYIPQSHFLPSVSFNDYTNIIEDAKAAGINMLRVWGGGIYENDIFYDLCDEHGILVWQDFMFAGSMYPADSAFIKNVEMEISDNVKRLRNHPSIVHWNGNNEIEVAWKNWGWQKQYGYSAQDSMKIWRDYLHLFHNKIPNLLSRLDDRSYTTTSPLSNWGTAENFNHSSMHYWGVWHGDDEFEAYEKNVGRFMSEYGFQSFPDIETIAFFADSVEWQLTNEVIQHHQKSYVGNEMISKHINTYFDPPIDFEDFVSKSQQTQATAMRMAIDAHRLRKGHCWGSLFWQLNDCWPGPSWSAIDVFGRKKVFYNDLDKLFAPVAIIPHLVGDQLVITLVNDSLDGVEGTMTLTLYDEQGDARKFTRWARAGKNDLVEIFRMNKPAENFFGEVQLSHEQVILHQREFKF